MTLTLVAPLRTECPETHLLLETSLVLGGGTTPLDLAEQAGLEVTLVESTGAEVPLHLGFINQYVEASWPVLERPQGQPRSFSAVRLRATQPISFARVIWFSYDPRETKSGVMLPKERESHGDAG